MKTEELKRQEATQPAVARKQAFGPPRYEVRTNKQAFEVDVYMPGVDAKSAEIVLEKGTLTVEGSRTEVAAAGWRPLYREIPDVDYRLRLQLNVEVDEEAIRAKSENGVLTITLPTAEEAKPRTIAIK
jgi:HSP20 family protein